MKIICKDDSGIAVHPVGMFVFYVMSLAMYAGFRWVASWTFRVVYFG